jgi:hypothetical protein
LISVVILFGTVDKARFCLKSARFAIKNAKSTCVAN